MVMIRLLKKFILVWLFASVFPFYNLAFGSIVSSSTCYESGGGDTACVTLNQGDGINPYYTNDRYSEPVIDFDSIANGRDIHVLNVDPEGWDVGTRGPGYTIVADENVETSWSIFFLVTDGTDFDMLVRDAIGGDIDDYGHIRFEINPNVEVKISGDSEDFVNHGQTVLLPGSSFSFYARNGSHVYSDEFLVGGSGPRTTFTVSGRPFFSFRHFVIGNADLDITGTSGVLPELSGSHKRFFAEGNTTTSIHSMVVDNGDYEAKFFIDNGGDNNVYTFDTGSMMMWENSSDYVKEEGPILYFRCLSSENCTKNKIILKEKSTFQVDLFYLDGQQEFYVDLTDQSSFGAERISMTGSNIFFNADNSVFEFAKNNTSSKGEIESGKGNSFVLNATNSSQVTFYSVVLRIQREGNFEMNISGNSTAVFSGATDMDLTIDNIYINVTDSSLEFGPLFLAGLGTLNIELAGDSKVTFDNNIDRMDMVPQVGYMSIHVANNSLVYFKETDIGGGVKVNINQEVYTDRSEQTLLRFDKVSTFLDEDLVYSYNLHIAVRDNNFSVKAGSASDLSIVLIQIKNDGPTAHFPEADELLVNEKINASGDGYEVGGGGSGSGTFSVLLNSQNDGDGAGLIDYKTIDGIEYAEFGFGAAGTFSYNKAQDQYGEESGLLTLTTIENMDSYGIAVVFDNIVLSETDTGDYRVTLFNLVINNSRTVEQLGQTLNSLGANITLSNISYNSTILALGDKHNAATLLDGDRYNAYAEVRNLANNNFEGKYLTFGASYIFYESKRYRFGISGFFSPYSTTTMFDAREQSINIAGSLYGAIQVGTDGGAIMIDVIAMHSILKGTALEVLSSADKRGYNYGGNSASATVSYSFGSDFSQRMVVTAFVNQSSSYTEKPSDLALNVITPSYYSAFVGYYSQLLDKNNFNLEAGVKFYFKEGQASGTAGFINDPAGQEWTYQYILLDSPVEFNVDFGYKINQNLKVMGSLSKRSSYSNFGLYIIYKKALYSDSQITKYKEDNYNIGNLDY